MSLIQFHISADAIMCYLDLPRFHLFGTFFANPSTINNMTPNYTPGTVLTEGTVGWDPGGQALFKVNVTVTGGTDAHGKPLTSGNDTLMNATLTSIATPNFAKIVDLDPDQQNVSQVFGLSVELTLSNGAVGFTGVVAPCALTDLWGRAIGGSGGPAIASAGGMFQSVIQVQWGPDLSGSPVLQALQAEAGDTLSIKWNADGFNGALGDPGFGYGQMAATIGPAYADEPQHFVAARRLLPPPAPVAPAPLWFAPFKVLEVDEQYFLVLDLGNSVGTIKSSNPPTSPPTPIPFYDTAGNSPPQSPQLAVVAGWFGAQTQIAVLDYSVTNYADFAGIFTVPLTDAELDAVQGQALAVASPPAPPPPGPGSPTYKYFIQESPDGVLVGADQSFLRLNPGDEVPVKFYATKLGVPYPNCAFDLSLVTPFGTAGNNNLPAEGLTWAPTPAVTGSDGTLTVTFTGGSTAGKPAWRKYTDGQVYFVSGAWWPMQLTLQGSVPVSAMVYDAWAPQNDPPTWWGDLQPVMAQYGTLYPGMVQILDISDYTTLQQSLVPSSTNAQLVAQALQLPVTDPGHMPVTRDLSAAKVQAYVDWVNAGCPEGTQPQAEAAGPAIVEAAGPEANAIVVPAGGFGPGASSIKSSIRPVQ